MGFGWEDALAAANPIGWGPALYKHATEGNGYTPPGPNTRKPLGAADIGLSDPLKDPLGKIAGQTQGNLSNALGRIKGQAATSSIASGRPVGQYQGEAIGRANTLASRGINDALGGTLGGASLKDKQNQIEFENNMALANEIGALNAPNLLQQVLGGVGGAANTGLKFKGLSDALGKNGSTGSSYQETSPSLNYYNPGSSGYSRYQ